MINFDKYWDEPLYGAASIAEVLNLRDENGKPDLTRTYHALACHYIDASKMGRVWTSTRRRLLSRHFATSEKTSC
jgi:hypothetical protein